MSFYCNNYHTENCPGPITNNPMNGLCEKTCIQVKKVFDACIKQMTLEHKQIKLNAPITMAAPEFISGKSCTSKGIINNLLIETLDDCSQLSRVKADVTIPLEIYYTDASGGEKKSYSSITFCQDVLMCLPEASIIPYDIEAVVSCVVPEGEFVDSETVEIAACITIILKVVIEVELLVPSYGYCPIAPAQDYTHEVCTGFFDLPLFPKTPCCKKKQNDCK